MAITVVPTYKGIQQNIQGAYTRKAKLTVTGLTAAAANTIPHGLPAMPGEVEYVGNSGTPGFETQAADATNLYFTTGAGQTSLTAYVRY